MNDLFDQGEAEAEAQDLVSDGLAEDDRPDVIMARFPASLVVSSLMSQLETGRGGYSTTDYLSSILDRVGLIRQKFPEERNLLADIDAALARVLDRVVEVIGRDTGIDFSLLNIEAGGAGYADRVLELYRFFCVDRLRNAQELLYVIASRGRKQIADSYRRDTPKKDQTVQNARRTFASYDDVLLWVNMPAVVDTICRGEDWTMSLSDVLAQLGDESGVPVDGYLRDVARQYSAETFSTAYLAPAVASAEVRTDTYLNMRDRWIASAQKKEEKQ